MFGIRLRGGACRYATAIILLAAAVVPLAGCEKTKEKAIDIEAPGVDVEVEKSKEDGAVNVGVNPNDERS